jgi:hypothetical protein
MKHLTKMQSKMRKEMCKESEHDYRSYDAIANSDIKSYVSGGFDGYLYNKLNFTDSDAMMRGRIIHSHLLDDEVSYEVIKGATFKTWSGVKALAVKAEYAKHGKDVILESDTPMLSMIENNITNHPLTNALIFDKTRQTEMSVYWDRKFDKDDIQFKGKLDVITEVDLTPFNTKDITFRQGITINDVKTTRDIEGFAWQAKKGRYFEQLAFYGSGYEEATGNKVDNYTITVISTQPPYNVRVFVLPISQIAEAYANNIHYGYKLYCDKQKHKLGEATSLTYPEPQEFYYG